MKVDIVTCYESNEERMSFVYDACLKRGYDVEAITSDFSHIRKEKRNNIPSGYISINAKPYRKNLSLERILSHRKFAKDAFSLLEKKDPDLIWLMAPANSLILEAKRYKERHPDVKIIIDIIDMWPESLPLGIGSDVFPLNIWRNIRRKNIICADALVTECDLYQEILKEEYKGEMKTIHWARDNRAYEKRVVLSDDILSLCYIGSINNIIDTTRIAKIVSGIQKPVKMHVIGEGENKDQFLSELSKVCEVDYHGAIRDEKKKTEIFDLCHAGINVYKEGLYIGLTVKCIDYFQHGIPIINNIKGDTWKMVEENDAGINIGEDNFVDPDKLIEMRKNNKTICELFENNFTKEVFTEKCLKVIDEVLK